MSKWRITTDIFLYDFTIFNRVGASRMGTKTMYVRLHIPLSGRLKRNFTVSLGVHRAVSQQVFAISCRHSERASCGTSPLLITVFLVLQF